MTYKYIQGLEKYADLHRTFETIEVGLFSYQIKWEKGKDDQRLLRSTTVFFYEILDALVGEFVHKYPACEVCDGRGRLLDPTITKLRERGYINEETRRLFDTLRRYGTIGNFKEEAAEKLSLSDIQNVYQKLLAYMPTFLRQFPEPQASPASADKAGNEGKTASENKAGFFKNGFGTEWKWGKVAVTAGVAALCVILIVSLTALHSANNRIALLESEAGEAEEQIASLTTENEKKIASLTEEKEALEKELEEAEKNTAEEVKEESDGEKEKETTEEVKKAANGHYAMGETWTVSGQWEVTMDKVTATASSGNGAKQEILIDYHYKNLGYVNKDSYVRKEGLYISLSLASVVDADGIVATDSGSPGIIFPEYVTVGATWSAQEDFLIYSDGNTATLTLSLTDGNGKKHDATFDLSW